MAQQSRDLLPHVWGEKQNQIHLVLRCLWLVGFTLGLDTDTNPNWT
jgi:hypothetical protein